MNQKADRVFNTKVTPWAEMRLKAIAAKSGITIYNFLHMMLDTIIRYMSPETNLTPEMERVISLFESPEDWKDQFNLCDPGDFQIEEALYFIGNEKKRGVRAVMIKRPFFGRWTQTVNVQDIFEAIICKIFPSRYRKLRLLATEWGCNSQLEVLDRLLDNELQGIDTQSIREEFEDCNRGDYGQKPSEHRYKRKMHKTVDGMEAYQQTIYFAPEDLPPLPEIEEEKEDWRDLDEKIGRAFGYED